MCVCVRQLPPDFFIYISIIKTVLCLHVSAHGYCMCVCVSVQTPAVYVCVPRLGLL